MLNCMCKACQTRESGACALKENFENMWFEMAHILIVTANATYDMHDQLAQFNTMQLTHWNF